MLQVVGEPGVESIDAAVHAHVLPPGQPHVEARGGELAELQNAGPILFGNAQDVPDHRDGKLRAVPFHHVDNTALGAHIVEQGGRGLLHPFPKRGNGSRGEDRRHQLAVAGVLRRLDRQERRRLQRMQQPSVGLVDHPPQRPGQARTDRADPEVVGAQQLVGDGVVEGDEHRPATNHRATATQLVGERGRVGPHLGIGDQTCLRVAAADTHG